MKGQHYFVVFLTFILIYFFATTVTDMSGNEPPVPLKIKGVNFVAPVNEISAKNLASLDRIGADWISVIPYAYTPEDEKRVIFFRHHPHWWGEGVEGAIGQVLLAKKKGLKVMLKPQVWVVSDGWPGEFTCETEAEWLQWEEEYRHYIMTYANLSDSLKVDLFCIGTEFRKAVVERPEFWSSLIKEVRSVYDGPLTYAANWDNYQNAGFWKELDFIGIDAYFPLSRDQVPEVSALVDQWQERIAELGEFSHKEGKGIIFTEYGYRSCDFNTHSPWEEAASDRINHQAQVNAYQALYESVWKEDWMLGGFLWKWFAVDQRAGGIEDGRFTPQNKPAEKVVARYYKGG